MGALTPHLQRQFAARCPPGWTARPETPLLPPDLARLLGYAPRADLLLERLDGARRLWIELEVSRADPVANHAKFATAHLFQPQLPTDTFVAMVSPHVTRGRRNLAANTVALMRALGMSAFQTVLLPHLSAPEIQRLNHTPLDQLATIDLPVEAELNRALAIADPVAATPDTRIHLAGDLLAVMLNVRQWNQALATPHGATLWGTRTVTYFVHDPQTALFAPSKFCAYTALPSAPLQIGSPAQTGAITMESYARAETLGRRLDGHVARSHLTRGLAMFETRSTDAPAFTARFAAWLRQHEAHVRLHPAGPIFLIPPTWFR